jgi:hypothetical protein
MKHEFFQNPFMFLVNCLMMWEGEWVKFDGIKVKILIFLAKISRLKKSLSTKILIKEPIKGVFIIFFYWFLSKEYQKW